MHSARLLAPFVVLAVLIGASCRGREESAGSTPAATTATPPSLPAVESSDVAAREKRAAVGRAPVIWIGLDGLELGSCSTGWPTRDGCRTGNASSAEGYAARLQSFFPLISPILWTTAATGVAPDVHRVLDFQEVDPKTGRKVPISGFSRAVPAVWNLASAAGRKVGVVGWWATHPAEEVDGLLRHRPREPDPLRQAVAFRASRIRRRSSPAWRRSFRATDA